MSVCICKTAKKIVSPARRRECEGFAARGRAEHVSRRKRRPQMTAVTAQRRSRRGPGMESANIVLDP